MSELINDENIELGNIDSHNIVDSDNALDDVSELCKKYNDLLLSYSNLYNEYVGYKHKISNEVKFGIKTFLSSFLKNIGGVVLCLKNCNSVDCKNIYSQLIAAFEKNGIKVIYPDLGEEYQYSTHEIVGLDSRSDFPNNSVVAVVEPGFIKDNEVLLPAKVIVNSLTLYE
jgi:molecular chaperone GrpE (heat shock protein)